jgi:DNA-binding LacI/PurR family transcriptional regulator
VTHKVVPVGRVTLQTIADQVGVSRMTVSNAFSRPDQLSAELRGRILGVAEQLGYVGPDPAARALASGTAGSVGLVLSDSLRHALTDEVAVEFLTAIADELTPTRLALTLLPSAEKDDFVPARDVAIDGAIVYLCHPASPAVAWLIRRRLPLVHVDQAPAAGIPSVNVDDRAGAAAAARHLVELGHRRIAIVTYGLVGDYGVFDELAVDGLANTERDRLLGWQQPLHDAGIKPTYIRLPHADSYELGVRATQQVVELTPRPTAVLCFSDAIARGLLAGLENAGVRVPADVSVVGFDDSPLAARTRPALTTVRQDVTAKGTAAARSLLTAIERAKSGKDGRVRHILLPTELVVRDSTARPPRRRSG